MHTQPPPALPAPPRRRDRGMSHEAHGRCCSSRTVRPVYRLTCASLRASRVAGGAEGAEPALPVLPGQRLLGGKASGAAGSRALARERAAAAARALPAARGRETAAGAWRGGERAGHVPPGAWRAGGGAHGVDTPGCPELAGAVGAGQGLLQEAGRAAPVSALGPRRGRARREAPCWWPWPREGCPGLASRAGSQGKGFVQGQSQRGGGWGTSAGTPRAAPARAEQPREPEGRLLCQREPSPGLTLPRCPSPAGPPVREGLKPHG